MRSSLAQCLIMAATILCISSNLDAASAKPATSWPPTAIAIGVARADRIAISIHRLFPKAIVRVDSDTNTLIVVAGPEDVIAIRSVVAALDVRGPQRPITEAVVSNTETASSLSKKIAPIFPSARLLVARKNMLLITATPADLAQIRLLITALDAPVVAPTMSPSLPTVAFPISQGRPAAIARALARALPRARIAVSGTAILVEGSAEDIAQVKPLLEQLDRPAASTPYVAVYRLSAVDATSVATLLSRSFPALPFEVTKDVNAISVNATTAQHARIANAIAQLDVNQIAGGQAGNFVSPSGNEFEVINLRAAVPPTSGSGSSSANDIAQTVTQALASSAQDLKITIEPNSTKLVLSGSSHSRELARRLIEQLDVAEPLVELDTRVLEIDEGAQTQLGLKFPTPTLATTYSEILPASANGSPDFLRLQGLTRTPLTLGAQLDFLISNNEAKILEDPRITTFSGRTATLRAGETVNILTTAGGGSGTVATTQIQSFQTGVTLDITPVVNTDNYITVTLHPSVNSIAGIGTSGVPNIQTRDTTTTIGLHDGETLIIGGLIEDTDTKTVQKIPLLGDIPFIGRLFQDTGTSHTRNELVVTVTPHILKPGDIGSVSRLQIAPSPLPTIPSKATLPPVLPNGKSFSTLPAAAYPAAPDQTLVPSPLPTASARPPNLPSAFSQANTYTYGSAPQSNYADANQPPRIFYIQVRPTVVKNGDNVTISALTTTNVVSLGLAPAPSGQAVSLSQIGTGKWQTTFRFDTTQLPSTAGNVNEKLTASTSEGTTTTINVPFTIPP